MIIYPSMRTQRCPG